MTKTAKKIASTHVLIVIIIICIVGSFMIGILFENNKNTALIPTKEAKNTLSEPAKLAEEFYKNYVDCWNETIGKKPQSEWNCDSLITTNYFTQPMIDSMSGRTKAYCGYEPPEEIYISEGNHYSDSRTEDIVLWGKFASDKPTIVSLRKNSENKWQIESITCSR